MSETERAGTSDSAPGATVFTLRNFALGLAVLVLVSFPDVLLGWRSFFTRDFSNFGYPIACHVQQSYRAGEVPLWNPYNFAGLPFLAQWNTLALYPPSLIYIALPLPWSLNLFNLFHLYFGGLGMFCLARRWVGDGRAASVAGVGYAFGGLMVSCLMWPNNVAALAWLPTVMLAGERAALNGGRSCFIAALVLALQFLAGAPEITALTWAGLALLILFGPEPGNVSIWLRSRRLAIVLVITTGLVAVQLLPFLELLQHSQRDTGFATGAWTLKWSGLGNFLVPLFRTFRDRGGIYFQHAQQWITTFYGGTTVVLFALIGICTTRNRRVALLVFASALSIALALGPDGFIYDWFRKAVPGLGLMRYPIKFIVPVVVALPLLAAFGARRWPERPGTPWLGLAAAIFLVTLSASLLVISEVRPTLREASDHTVRSGLTCMACLAVLIGLLFAAQNSKATSPWLPPLAVALTVYADLFLANRHVNPVVNTAAMEMNVSVVDPKPRLGEARVMVATAAHERLDATNFTTLEAEVQLPRSALLLNVNLLERVPKLDGFFSLYLPKPEALIARLGRQPTNSTSQGLLDFLCVSHVSRPEAPWVWQRRTNFLPLLALVPRALPLDPGGAFGQLFSGTFNPRECVFLPKETSQDADVPGEGRGRIIPRRISAHRIEATVEADHPMLLTMAQANYPGWRADVDNQEVPIWTANGAFQAIRIPTGRHEVRICFRSITFVTGTIISVLTLVIGVTCCSPRKSRSIPELVPS